MKLRSSASSNTNDNKFVNIATSGADPPSLTLCSTGCKLSYPPITNLSIVSKLLERLVAQQLTTYLTNNGVLPDLQSTYRAHHLTETAVLKVIGDILLALDSSNLALLSLLDLSAAFDTVDHDMKLRRLQTSYGLDGVVIK